jgi:heterodisulfide reductase subunit A-like polyferredoxin
MGSIECASRAPWGLPRLISFALMGVLMLTGLAPQARSAALQCDVAIVGGGPSGVHTAYKLTTMHLAAGPVCLFEMKDHLGGRVGNNFTVG